MDFRRKVAPVPPSGEGADRGTLPRGGGRRVAAAQRVVYLLEGRGNQPTGRLAQQLRVGPPEEPFGLSIQRHHSAPLVDDDDGIWSGVEHLPKPLVLQGTLRAAGVRSTQLPHDSPLVR